MSVDKRKYSHPLHGFRLLTPNNRFSVCVEDGAESSGRIVESFDCRVRIGGCSRLSLRGRRRWRCAGRRRWLCIRRSNRTAGIAAWREQKCAGCVRRVRRLWQRPNAERRADNRRHVRLEKVVGFSRAVEPTRLWPKDVNRQPELCANVFDHPQAFLIVGAAAPHVCDDAMLPNLLGERLECADYALQLEWSGTPFFLFFLTLNVAATFVKLAIEPPIMSTLPS